MSNPLSYGDWPLDRETSRNLPRIAEVLRLRYSGYSLRNVGQLMGISRERVRQLQKWGVRNFGVPYPESAHHRKSARTDKLWDETPIAWRSRWGIPDRIDMNGYAMTRQNPVVRAALGLSPKP